METHPYVHIYKWRLQQEHNMKAKNGGKGMTDAQVEAYVHSPNVLPSFSFVLYLGLLIATFPAMSSLETAL